ncbi:RNA methyltransferase, TrmH family, group 3 [Beutenbergia cavernae DSM 12333]|uniref:RNA methyltransferase, TrmH family, group 3 n=1 Tax=Beutenbergia cavernae (strain ATCC BAA-8 / DSM 12333 / CCUG 43141 / JCM 11478 / NBRC 16432 / NCIMB 13614 / HKI 0122) TaxID=471853 RepID=C5BYT4_BEUC1|nr:23S rRNA (guanosine(2251)-2'-O)-methyltransferase RlmB [Beutenbergia cavernae]ACQ79042.1 RNA methyltransferase, TrmH family, group 3 [Beutenbergia cavernae DSM 12333]
MPGNSKRRGAVRKPGSKKGPTVGSGGQRRRGLEGRGPTPKATERTGHPAQRKAAAAERRAATRPGGAGAQGRSGTQRQRGTEVIGGRNSVLEALRARIPATTLYVASRVDADDRIREILRIGTGRALPLIETTKTELDRLADGAVHQGVVLAVPPYDYAEPAELLEAAERSGTPALVIALDSITDPRNLGAVLRSAGAFGAHGVLVPARRSAGVTAAAWKTSAGAAARVPVARATNLVRALQEYQAAGCFVVGLDGDGPGMVGDLPVADGPVVLVVGSEGKGLSRLVRETCDVVAAIPIASSVESLNASVAASIALYEVARRRA